MSALLALGLLLSAGSAAPEVVVSSGEAHACLVLDAERVVGGLAGGLLLSGLNGKAEELRLLTSLDGLPGSSVRALLADQEGSAGFWVGTESGLAHLRWQGATVVVDRALPGPDVRSLAWHTGRLYVGTWGQGLLRLQMEAGVLEPVAPPADGAERLGALTSWQGQLWAGGQGLFRLEAGRLVPVALGLALPLVQALAADQQRLWVATLGGVLTLAPDGSLDQALQADARGLWIDTQGLIVATLGAGLMRRPQGQHGFELADGPDTWLFGAHRRGLVTCVAGTGGLAIERGGWRAVRWAGPASSDVSALALQEERLLVGTFDQGLAVRVGGDWTTLPVSVVDARVNALASQPGSGVTWVATARGLYALHGDQARRLGPQEGLPAADVHTVVALPRAGIVAATAAGAALVDGERARPLEGAGGPGRRAVWAVAEQADGTLWVGTSQGLFWRTLGGRWQRETLAGGSLPDDWVTALAVAGSQVFVGTYAHGVVRLGQAQGRLLGGAALGGQHVNVGGLTVSEGVLFAATMEGLLWRELPGAGRPVGETGAWRHVPRAAPGQDVTAVVADQTHVWVASRRGLARWQRERLLAR